MTGNLEELKALIGLKMCDGIGDITAHKLILSCGSAVAVFKEKREHLSSISGVQSKVFDLLHENVDWGRVDKEIGYIEDNCINYVTLFDKEYPQSLLLTESPPLLLFFTGSIGVINTIPCISIVGTRNATSYGLDVIVEMFKALKKVDVCIISGLAHGIDIAAHKESMKYTIPTFGVVAHGLRTVYPRIHEIYAQKMKVLGGGIITEFFSDEIPNRENFPKRNRIIAGLSSATIVIEAAKRGGALITAELALAYNRKVFAFPGRYNDKYSEGCNSLIMQRRVRPVLSILSLIEELGFKSPKKNSTLPVEMNLSSEELSMIQIIKESTKIGLDNISAKSQLSISGCSSILFGLEMRGVIRSLPGKIYELS